MSPEETTKLIKHLRISLGRLEIGFDAIKDAIVWVNNDKKVQWCNKSFADMVGKQPIIILSEKINDVIQLIKVEDDTHPAVQAALKQDENINEIKLYNFEQNGLTKTLEVIKTGVPGLDHGEIQIMVLRDITERIRAEEILRDSETRLRGSIINSPNPIMIHAEDGEVIMLSNAWSEITGYDIKDIPTTAIWSARAYGTQADENDDYIESLYGLKETRKEGEYKVKTASEEIRLWDFQSQPLPKLPDGRRVVLSLALDITERKRMEKLLKAEVLFSEFALTHTLDELLTRMLDEVEAMTGSQIGFFHFLEDDQIMFHLQTWSTNTLQNMCTAEGKGDHYPVEEAGVWADCVHERRPVIHNDYAGLAHKKGMPDGHAPVHRELVVPIIRGNKVMGVLGVGNKETDYNEQDVKIVSTLVDLTWDIVVAKRSEKWIRDSEEKYRSLVESSSDWIWEVDQNMVFTYSSPTVREILGYKPEEIVGKTPFDLMPPEEAKRIADKASSLMKTRKSFKGLENSNLHTDEHVVVVETSGVPVFDDNNGELLGYRGINRDITERKQLEQERQDNNIRLRAGLIATIQVIARTVEARDPYTAGHQLRVSQLSRAIAKEMGLDNDQTEGLRLGALIHDIGKIQVPSDLLSKPVVLSANEIALIKEHTRYGYDILKDIEFPWPVADMAYQHHERLDGSGYPQGLKGNAICLEVRIIAVADVVEAMSSHRPYRPSLGIDKAFNEIEAHKGVRFQPEVVDACLKLFRKKGFSFG
jgi:PAS domain S-box-containing protein/putative nucleotidyltransferase with HDIG domain